MGRHNVNLLPSCLEMPAVAFTASRLGDLQAPPGHGDDISAGELAAFTADGRLPFAKRPTAARPQRQRWDKRGGRQSRHSLTPWRMGRASSLKRAPWGFRLTPSLWRPDTPVGCWRSADLIGLLRQRSGDCRDSFAISGRMSRDVVHCCLWDVEAVAFRLLREQPATSSTDATRTLFFSPILHPPRGRVNHWGSDRCRSSGAAFCRVCCICLSWIWCTPSTTSWGVDLVCLLDLYYTLKTHLKI